MRTDHRTDEDFLICGGDVGLKIGVGAGDPTPQTEGDAAGIKFRIGVPAGTELPLPGEITFNYLTVDGTAIGGGPGDFVKIPSTAGSIPAATGFTEVTVSLVAADAVWKPDRFFSLRITDAKLAGDDVVMSPAQNTGLIRDSLPVPTISIGPGLPNPAVQGQDIQQDFDIDATVAVGVDTLVDFATRNGSAPVGSFDAKSGTVTIGSGQTTGQANITINSVPLAVGTQNYFVDTMNARAILGPITEDLSITVATGQGNIKGADAINISVRPPNPQTEGAPAGSTFRIESDGTPPLPQDITGTWRTVSGTAVANEPGDFVGQAETGFTIPAADGFVDIVVGMMAADAVWAPDRSFTAEITGSIAPINTASAEATITDDLGKPTISISDPGLPDPSSRPGTITFTLTASEAPKYDIDIDVQTQDNTAQAGIDYVAVNTTVTIPAGQTTVTVIVTVLP